MSDKLEYTDLLRKPFKMGGRGPDNYDCWGVCLELGKRVGLAFPEEFTPDEDEGKDRVIRSYTEGDSDFERIAEPEPFCIVTFTVHPPFVDHCGIVLEDVNYFLHAVNGHAVVRQRLTNRVMKPKIEGYYRLKH